MTVAVLSKRNANADWSDEAARQPEIYNVVLVHRDWSDSSSLRWISEKLQIDLRYVWSF